MGSRCESRPTALPAGGLYSPHGTVTRRFYLTMHNQSQRSHRRSMAWAGRRGLRGGQYAMRLWIKPDQLAKLAFTVTDITNSIQAQSKVNPAGQVGGEPASGNQQYTYALLAQGRLTSPGRIRQHRCSRSSEWRDRARERRCSSRAGQQDYSTISRLNGKPSAIIAIYNFRDLTPFKPRRASASS